MNLTDQINAAAGEIEAAARKGGLDSWAADQLETDAKAGEIVISYGGPTVWLDAANGRVCGHEQGADIKCVWLSPEAASAARAVVGGAAGEGAGA